MSLIVPTMTSTYGKNCLYKSDFVTRLKDSPRVRYLQIKILHKMKNKDGVLYDGPYKPTNKTNCKKKSKITTCDLSRSSVPENISFVCSDSKISGQTIADIYKRRWAVELLFHWLKGHLDIRRLPVKQKMLSGFCWPVTVLF
ncbi:MAG: transposase [Bdellovibrionales bacterium]|nr:transposase [Bdellovibrionales bacterium]